MCVNVESKRSRQTIRTDIILLYVGVDQCHLGLVRGVFHGRFDDLVHWGDTRSSGDHEQVRCEVSPGISRASVGIRKLKRREA
jgi:hypothetical protein